MHKSSSEEEELMFELARNHNETELIKCRNNSKRKIRNSVKEFNHN